jgi:hypothetical protein
MAIEFERICERERFARSVIVSMNGNESASGGTGNETWHFLKDCIRKKRICHCQRKTGGQSTMNSNFEDNS